MKKINKIIYPTPNRAFSTWNYYLLLGLSEMRVKIEANEELWEDYPNVQGIILFDVIWDSGKKQRVWYDISDFTKHYYKEVMRKDDLYFKIQLHKKDRHYSKIYPIGQITCRLDFPKKVLDYRVIRNKQDFIYDVIGIFRDTDHGIRRKAVEIVNSKKWESLVGMAYHRNRSPIPEKIAHGKLNYEEHLRLQCRSKICLDLPGVGGDWTWRSAEILAMGCFCLRAKSDQVLLEGHERCWGEVNADLSDLTEKIDYYLSNEIEREQIAKNGLQYYENHLSPTAQAEYFLKILNEDQ